MKDTTKQSTSPTCWSCCSSLETRLLSAGVWSTEQRQETQSVNRLRLMKLCFDKMAHTKLLTKHTPSSQQHHPMAVAPRQDTPQTLLRNHSRNTIKSPRCWLGLQIPQIPMRSSICKMWCTGLIHGGPTPNIQDPDQLVRTEEASLMRGETSSRNEDTRPVAYDTPLRINLQYLKCLSWPRFNFNLTGQIRSILEYDPWTFDANSFVLRFVAL